MPDSDRGADGDEVLAGVRIPLELEVARLSAAGVPSLAAGTAVGVGAVAVCDVGVWWLGEAVE